MHPVVNFFRKFGIILLIIIPLTILVIIRAAGKNHFQPDAGRHAMRSFELSNIFRPEMLYSAEGDKLIIGLEKDVLKHISGNITSVYIQPDSILFGNNLSLIADHKGPVILVSGDKSISAGIWMLLSQMGFDNLYIYSDDPEPEVLKYEFRPDTTARPESLPQ